MTTVNEMLIQRQSIYGEFKNHAEIESLLMSVVEDFQGNLDKVQRVGLHMIIHKIARVLNTPDPDYLDNWRDIAGYATLVEKDIKRRQTTASINNVMSHD